MLFDSDLAEERRRTSFKDGGVLFSESYCDGVKMTDIRIATSEGAEALGRPCGRYLTLSFDALHLLVKEESKHLKRALASALAEILPSSFERILFLGLGNRYMCADSVGVLSAEGVMKEAKEGVFCLTPGTRGQAGVDAATLAKAVAGAVGADVVVAIDALAAREKERLFRAFEITDTGISPGTGVGNRALPVSADTVGVKVVAVGIPTVMRASAFLKNELMRSGASEGEAEEHAKRGDGLFALPMHFEEDARAIARILSTSFCEVIQKKRGI